MSLLKSVSSNVRSYIIADGFYYAGYSVINAFLSILITDKITGGRLDLVGYAISYYMLIRALAEIPISRITRKASFVTRRNIIASAYIVYGIVIFTLGFAEMFWQVLLIQTIAGLLDATAYPIKWTLFTRLVDKGHEELEWGLEDITSTLLPAAFTALAGIVSARFGLMYAFVLFAILLIISGITFLRIKPPNVVPQSVTR